MMEYILQTDNIVKSYGKTKALNGLSMKIPKGAIYGFIGRNGAGKTTAIRIICGLQNPNEGSFTLFNVNSHDKKICEVRKRTGAIIEKPAFYSDLSAEKNLKLQYDMLGIPSYDDIPELLKLVGLSDTEKKKAGKFSLGMKQRLGIAIALAGNPDFILLDEPINGIDPQGIVEIRELILTINKEKGVTVLISSHILDELSKLATHYGFIDKGRIVEEISAEELEKKCRKVTKLKVSDEKALLLLLDEIGFDYEVEADGHINVFGKINVTELVTKLASSGCELLSVNESDESLENYYINLVGSGEKD